MPTSSDTSIFIKESSSASTEPEGIALDDDVEYIDLSLGNCSPGFRATTFTTLGQLGRTLGGLTLSAI